jgi:hypothetical protein
MTNLPNTSESQPHHEPPLAAPIEGFNNSAKWREDHTYY